MITNKNFKLSSTELAKVSEVLELTEAEVLATKKKFTTLIKTDENTIIVKDWLDDSVQIVKLK